MVNAPASTSQQPADLLRPLWRRSRFWVALAVAAIIGAVCVGFLTDSPTRPLDPSSPARNGSLALSRVIEGYGVPVVRATSLASATGTDTTVLVTDPDAYSARQLRALSRSAGRLVLVAPGERTARALLPGVTVDESATVADEPGCGLAAATSAGAIGWDEGTIAYRAPTQCYGGAVVGNGAPQPTVILLGTATLLYNDKLDRGGAAALGVNLLTADRTAARVVWLLPGADAAGDGPASIWDLFPDGAHRVFWWLLVVGVAFALWRARRLGGVVAEPLPVVVRAAEIVEGHGRLYERAGARDHAATPLRAAAARRLAERMALPRGSSAHQVAAAVAPLVARAPAEVTHLLTGPPPTDDDELVRLARELDRLDAALGDVLKEGRS